MFRVVAKGDKLFVIFRFGGFVLKRELSLSDLFEMLEFEQWLISKGFRPDRAKSLAHKWLILRVLHLDPVMAKGFLLRVYSNHKRPLNAYYDFKSAWKWYHKFKNSAVILPAK